MCNGKECMNEAAIKAAEMKRSVVESKEARRRGGGGNQGGGRNGGGEKKWSARREEEKLETLLQLIFWGPN
ncbi:hypothetical protein SLEP1_g26601 [Rubroshorea leprosula]|uniref:Uncharacterized protein n=1 Tax=Rubroshorea leprosula TaxID=152421 RepID=A0AAV5JW74_9ROSI|nr:hypothetical protein SLEP1_g26601 [Rubroshorea leprosula]